MVKRAMAAAAVALALVAPLNGRAAARQGAKVVAVAEACVTNGFIMARHTNSDALSAAGYAVVVLPRVASSNHLAAVMDRVDALVIAGAVKGNLYNTRVSFEKMLIGMALERGLPVVGFCHGCQVINLYFGGKLGSVPKGNPPKVVHKGKESPYVKDCFHEITIKEGSRLAEGFGGTRATVNTSHGYCITKPGEGLEVTARAADGVVEAVEHRTLPVTGFQFHPERIGSKDPKCLRIIRDAIEHPAAGRR